MSRNDKKIKIEIDWLIKRVHRINESDIDDYSELEFLIPLLSDKRIILIGENGHGVAEHTRIKKKLIKYLYEKLGFRILAFESSLGDCSLSYMHHLNLSPKKLVKQSLFKVWHTEEMVELFKWIKDNQKRDSPFIFTGIDIQPTFKNNNITSEMLVCVFENIDAEYAKQINKIEQELQYYYVNHAKNKKNKKKLKELNERYKYFLILFQENQIFLQQKFDFKTLLIVERVLKNRKYLIDMIAANYMKAIKIRNKIMAKNIRWLAEEMFGGEKIIIWAHNNHIAKRLKGLIGFKSTFSYVPPELQSLSYSIGMFMYSGYAVDGNLKKYKVKNLDNDSIEFRMKNTGLNTSFLDISRQKKALESRWLFGYTYTMDEGKHLSLIKPSDCYDGLITCYKTESPSYFDL